MASKTTEERQQVDPRDEPSAAWGWHGSFPKVVRAMGWFIAFGLFIMLIGNHENNTENVWLVGLGLGVIVLLLIDIRRSRTAWRR